MNNSLARVFPVQPAWNALGAAPWNGTRLQPLGSWAGIGTALSGLGNLISTGLNAAVQYAVPQLINNAIGGSAPTAQNTAGVPQGYFPVGSGMYMNPAGQLINLNQNPAVNPQTGTSAVPSWVIPAAIGVGGILLFVALRKK